MSRSVQDLQRFGISCGFGGSGISGGSVHSPQLPPDHVLCSGAVIYPGTLDQHGFPLVLFPVDGQTKLCSDKVSKAQVVDFITYFLSLHSEKKDQDSLVSVVADLRWASLSTTRFIAETLLLLEVQKRMVHSVYIIQPKKKDVLKVLVKLLAPSKVSVLFKKVLLKEMFELSNYIDRSQLPPSLGGYFMFCHQSWVDFIKQMDGFLQDFLSVLLRLPSCMSNLQLLSTLPVPSTFTELQSFCSTTEEHFQQLRRELRLDQLLIHCERLLDKLHHPQKEACYQAMAGTALFTSTAFNMIHNYNRISATVQKVEQMWQQIFSKARLQLQVFQLRDDALQITQQIEMLLQDKLQPYKMEIAKGAAKAELLVSEFTVSIHTPAMVLVRRAENIINMLVDLLPLDGQSRERWVLDLERLKDKLHSTVHYTLQTLRAVHSYHHYYKKADSWYRLVLSENILQELLSNVDGKSNPRQNSAPVWRRKQSAFLNNNPPPNMEELLHLTHLSSVIPDGHIQEEGKHLSQRCISLRKLIISSGPVAVDQLQSALQWQYHFLRGTQVAPPPSSVAPPPGHVVDGFLDAYTEPSCKSPLDAPCKSPLNMPCSSDGSWCGSESDLTKLRPSGSVTPETQSPRASAQCNPATLSSVGAKNRHLDETEGMSRSGGGGDSVRPALSWTRINEENMVGLWGSEEPTDPSSPSVQVVSKVTADSLNFEIKVKRSAALPQNPWLSLPVEDLENSYTVTITQNPQSQLGDPKVHRTSSCQNHQTRDWTFSSQSTLEDSELSPIHDVLSSTIRDKSSCTTDRTTTMIWDSYDLHDQYTDGVIDGSLKDWDIKEQEGLREVENILDRADHILQEEEKVLDQEAILNVLLEDSPGQWPPWNAEVQPAQMSSSELAEAGVLGLEDCPVSAELHTSEVNVNHNGADLLMELHEVHLLDQLIVEENLKIHELRQCSQEEASRTSASDLNRTFTLRDERRVFGQEEERSLEERDERHAFRLQLEKERNEVEELERNEVVEELERNGVVEELERDGVVEELQRDEVVEELQRDEVVEELERDEVVEELERDEVVEELERDEVVEKLERDQVVEELERDQVVEELERDQVVEELERDQVVEELERGDTLNGAGKELRCSPVEDGMQNEAGAFCGGNLDDVDQLEPNTKSSWNLEEPTPKLSSLDENVFSSDSEVDLTVDNPQSSSTLETQLKDGVFDPGGGDNWHQAPPSVSSSITEEEAPHSTEVTSADVSSCDPPVQDRLQVLCPHAKEPPDQDNFQILRPHAKEPPDQDQLQVLCPNATEPPDQDQLQVLCPNAKEPPDQDNFQILHPHVKEPPDRDQLQVLSPHAKEPPDQDQLQVLHSNNNNNNGMTVYPQMVLEELSVSTKGWTDECPHRCSPDVPLEFDPGGADVLQVCENTRMSASGIPNQLNGGITQMSSFQTPVVLDTGSGLMKAGFADQDLPSVIFPTVIGRPKYEEIMNSSAERDVYIGHEAQHMRGVLALKHPIRNGIIHNWDDMEKIWHHTFHQLGADPQDHPVLLTEAAMNPLKNRQRTVELMFECFDVPFTYVAMQAVLALYAAGRTTGVVLDSGDGVSHSVPVFEGYCLPHAVQRFPLAGLDVTINLKKLLQEQGVSMRTSAELEIVREMKEKCCCLALNYEQELREGPSGSEGVMHYTLPDGQVVSLGTERFRAPEILFKPQLIGQDHYGMHESIFKSILSSDIDLRRNFLGNVILSGGNTLLAGLPQRLEVELRGLVTSDLWDSVRVCSPSDRDFSVWRGGAVLANVATGSASSGLAWISQDEYEECGSQIVFRKCF